MSYTSQLSNTEKQPLLQEKDDDDDDEEQEQETKKEFSTPPDSKRSLEQAFREASTASTTDQTTPPPPPTSTDDDDDDPCSCNDDEQQETSITGDDDNSDVIIENSDVDDDADNKKKDALIRELQIKLRLLQDRHSARLTRLDNDQKQNLLEMQTEHEHDLQSIGCLLLNKHAAHSDLLKCQQELYQIQDKFTRLFSVAPSEQETTNSLL
eukprot:gene5149-5799_t